MLRRKSKSKIIVILLFLLPAGVMYGYFFITPTINALFISLTEWNGFSEQKNFIGLENFRELISDKIFHIALVNTLMYVIIGGILIFSIALILTYVLSKDGIRGKKIFSNLFYFPNMIAVSALAVLWAFVYNPNFGLLNNILRTLGLENFTQAWLGSRGLGIPSLTVAFTWSYVGFFLILFLAGVDKIPNTYSEAAKVEGASDITIFFKITLPLLRDVFIIAISLWIITGMKLFELIWAVTKGGPGFATQTIATYMYQTIFGTTMIPIYKLGYGTSISVVLLLIIVSFVFVFRKFAEKEPIEF